MKEDCQTSGVLPDQTVGMNTAIQLQPCFILQGKEREGKKFRRHPGYHSHRLEAASSLILEGGVLSKSCRGGTLWSRRGPHPAKLCGWHCHPSVPGGRASNQKGLFSSPKISWNLSCQHLDLPGTYHSLFPSDFSLFGRSMSVLCLSHHCIWETHSLSGFTGSHLGRNFASG